MPFENSALSLSGSLDVYWIGFEFRFFFFPIDLQFYIKIMKTSNGVVGACIKAICIRPNKMEY